MDRFATKEHKNHKKGKKIPARPNRRTMIKLCRMSHSTDNICAGTQVVALTEVRGTNNSLVWENALTLANGQRTQGGIAARNSF